MVELDKNNGDIMKCMHCKSEWNVSSELSVSVTKCPFCGKTLVEKRNEDSVEGVFAAIYRDYGEAVLRNGKNLRGYFADLAPERKKERLILSHFISCDGHTILLDAKIQNANPQLFIERIVYKMTDELLLSEELSRYICEKYWIGIGGSPLGQGVSAPEEEPAVQKKVPLPEKRVSSAKTSKVITELTPEEQFQKGEECYNAKDYSEAFDWYSKAANRGHALAQCQLGLLYRDGHGVSKDEKQAFLWFVKAANASQNCPRGKFYVGRCYEFGTGVSQNIKEAIRWYTLAAQQGDAYAQINLAICYRLGKGVQSSYAEAARLLSLAADQGDPLAQYHLGLLYKEGKGVQKDLNKAFNYFSQSANRGESYGQLELGYCYWRGEGVERDYAKAFIWFKVAAEQGAEEAQERVGYCYEKGEGTNRDINQALYWYEKAASNGQASAMKMLGDCYADDDSSTKDYKKAVYWYKKAVDHGDKSALISLGNCYSEGKGVSQDSKKAMSLFETAYSKGEIFALEPILWEYAIQDQLSEAECKHIISLTTPKPTGNAELDSIEVRIIDLIIVESGFNIAFDMVKYPSTKATGIEWMHKCAEGDEGDERTVRAQLWLGESYRLGDDLPKNKEKAIYWYEKAAAQGDQDAKDRLKLMKKGVLSYLFS